MSAIEQLLASFQASFSAGVKEGDRCVMAAALYNKVLKPDLQQPRSKRPERTRVIQAVLSKQFDIKGLPVWGATAVRGDLMDAKEHIRLFIDLVNRLEPGETGDAWQRFGKLYKSVMDVGHKPIQLNPTGSIVEQLGELGKRPSVGRIQQPLCYAVIHFIAKSLGPGYETRTKRVFAGDKQSGEKGDIQVFFGGQMLAVFEIKAHRVNALKLGEVLAGHGAHPYALIVVATGFTADARRATHRNLLLVTIDEFIAMGTLLGAMSVRAGLEQAGRQVMESYNAIMRDIEARPDLCVEVPPLPPS